MKISRILAGVAIASLGCLSWCTLADDESEAKSGYYYSNWHWFGSGASIQDLRERSTNSFELLDENKSGSITFEEIDLVQSDTELEQMKPEELREYRQRTTVIHSKFMNWSVEFEEFEVVDTNDDGVWTKEEHEVRHEILQSHRLKLGFEEWDADENDAIELHEFNSHLDELEMLDENADGTVSHKEAFKSENDQVISDVLTKLKADEAIWASVKAVRADLEAQEEATRYMFIKQKEADNADK
ncbi:MAG: hypothetical protein F4Z01_04740 [Gammaproteobacteria bacterium]|nr:hypothetical protein [Gammaproteobacteria bacterium]MYF38281.1 hypothetical protein [Gammaproteobacteria bacterium]